MAQIQAGTTGEVDALSQWQFIPGQAGATGEIGYWDVSLSGTTVGSATSPNGWNVQGSGCNCSYSPATTGSTALTVTAPSNAPAGAYAVGRVECLAPGGPSGNFKCHADGTFDVIAADTSVLGPGPAACGM